MFLTRIGYGIIYFLDLIYEIIKSTIDVAFNKIMRRDINPVVIDVETVLKRPVSQTILANSISLTPGTLSVDLDSENQIIKVAAISPRSKEDIIPFEPYIKKMLE
ncbi:MAG: monovalent cation/H+ antiporter subunit E [Methanobrevibacter sp.]|uniref:monovalent cation/H+ antiporter subunit E n=1 Tax=Methanobrevibacter sp. TaxID=66852 RepID=UPI0025DBE970|nr:monovalent cation/H+ antiporter subunit E [Methanobrevibacter sp.]MBR6024028.1 monovalent cation/H+ antiporter subunit E [Methanobrevibacter sp.]MEE0025740.1 monovalent cation/H+ antiporter subunit E [Methanobrevibacter sp.]